MNLSKLLGKQILKSYFPCSYFVFFFTNSCSYNWWTLFVMAAAQYDNPIVDYTGPKFCHATQAVCLFGVIGNFWLGLGQFAKTETCLESSKLSCSIYRNCYPKADLYQAPTHCGRMHIWDIFSTDTHLGTHFGNLSHTGHSNCCGAKKVNPGPKIDVLWTLDGNGRGYRYYY